MRAAITIKLNNLIDRDMIDHLVTAANEGVKVKLIIRGSCGPLPDHRNIEAISIVDRFLEHARVLIFANRGKELFFLSSGDWMTRNLDTRVEVTFPVFDPNVKVQLAHLISLQWRDNVKARILDRGQTNKFRLPHGRKAVRSQYEIFKYLSKRATHT
jgi:polyphosphate kinase